MPSADNYDVCVKIVSRSPHGRADRSKRNYQRKVASEIFLQFRPLLSGQLIEVFANPYQPFIHRLSFHGDGVRGAAVIVPS